MASSSSKFKKNTDPFSRIALTSAMLQRQPAPPALRYKSATLGKTLDLSPNGCPQIPSPLLKNGIRRNQSMTMDELETKFLHAVEFGDVSLVKRLLEKHPEMDVDCTDGLGRTPLRLAVKNENKELVEILLAVSSPNNLHESLLQAIDSGFTPIAETTLKHPRYTDVVNKRRRMGDTDGFFKPEHGSQFPSYVTPLKLAAQKEQYVIVKLLLQRGETIAKPHKFTCSCQECLNKNKFDQLRMAKCRLDAYQGLASEAYICLNFQDPIVTAMELAEELKKQAENELYFKLEYNNLVDQLSCYLVRLLDRVWTHQELNIVLDKTGAPWEDRYESLARLKMALEFHQKKFVAHPNCQQRVVQRWYKGTGRLSMARWNQKLVIVILSFLAFPFAVLVFLVRPRSKFAGLLRIPTVKFLSHVISYFVFLTLILVSSTDMTGKIHNSNTLLNVYPHVHEKYSLYRNQSRLPSCGHDFPVRGVHPTVTEIMLMIWVAALIVQECQELWSLGLSNHMQDFYNIMDFLLLSVYTASFTLRTMVIYRVIKALDYFETATDLSRDPFLTESNVYWLNADRRFWHGTDPINTVEGLFAMANILSITRVTSLLPANEMLGPLQISLGRMVTDVFRFLTLSGLVIAGFMVSLQNLFWYYANRREIELDPDKISDPTAVKYYGSALATFRTVFWAIYGRGGTKAVSLGGYNNTMTETIGETIDSLYHITMIILLLNIFIAMMTRSYEQITADEDVEWKFARSSLYMNYISEGRLLPVPLNVLEIPHGIVFSCIHHMKQSSFFRRPIERVRKSYSDRRRPAIVLTKSTKAKIQSRFEKTESREMGTIQRQESLSSGFRKNRSYSTRTTAYQEVMQRIVHRYIMDVQRQNEDGGNADEIRSSMDAMRSEVFTTSRQKDENLVIATTALSNVALDLGKIAEGEDTNELASMCSLLDWWEKTRDVGDCDSYGNVKKVYEQDLQREQLEYEKGNKMLPNMDNDIDSLNDGDNEDRISIYSNTNNLRASTKGHLVRQVRVSVEGIAEMKEEENEHETPRDIVVKHKNKNKDSKLNNQEDGFLVLAGGDGGSGGAAAFGGSFSDGGDGCESEVDRTVLGYDDDDNNDDGDGCWNTKDDEDGGSILEDIINFVIDSGEEEDDLEKEGDEEITDKRVLEGKKRQVIGNEEAKAVGSRNINVFSIGCDANKNNKD